MTEPMPPTTLLLGQWPAPPDPEEFTRRVLRDEVYVAWDEISCSRRWDFCPEMPDGVMVTLKANNIVLHLCWRKKLTEGQLNVWRVFLYGRHSMRRYLKHEHHHS